MKGDGGRHTPNYKDYVLLAAFQFHSFKCGKDIGQLDLAHFLFYYILNLLLII